jgi:hypothetical protein
VACRVRAEQPRLGPAVFRGHATPWRLRGKAMRSRMRAYDRNRPVTELAALAAQSILRGRRQAGMARFGVTPTCTRRPEADVKRLEGRTTRAVMTEKMP